MYTGQKGNSGSANDKKNEQKNQKLLINFDDDDEEEEEDKKPKTNEKPISLLTAALNKAHEKRDSIYNNNQSSQGNQHGNNSQSKSKERTSPNSLSNPYDKKTGSTTTYSPVQSTILTYNVNNDKRKPNQNIVYVNSDEIEDISKKYDPNIKDKEQKTEMFSRFSSFGRKDNEARYLEEDKPEPSKSKFDPNILARQKLLEQQKLKLLEQQKMQFQSQSMVSNQNYKPNFDALKSYLPNKQDDIDTNKLANILPQNRNFYEPGQMNTKEHPTNINNHHNEQDKEKNKKTYQSTFLKHASEDEEDHLDEKIIQEAQARKEAEKKIKKEREKEEIVHTSRNTRKNEEERKNSDDDEGEDGEEDDEDDCNFGDAKPNKDFEVSNIRNFMLKPVPKGLLIQCTIKRDKSGFGRLFPKYHLFLTNGLQYLMSAKKRANNKTSNYMLCLNKDFKKKSSQYMGKLRSNFLGTEFIFYDTGLNPKNTSDFSKMRVQQGVILYDSNLMGERGPRKMKVLIPDIKQNGDYIEWRPTNNKDGMLANFKEGEYEGMKIFQNKEPTWSDEVQAFVLNFNGRVDKPSVKNFQLVDMSNDGIIFMQFGRVGDAIFNLDFQYPFSPLQAFAICLSSFDYKIACE